MQTALGALPSHKAQLFYGPRRPATARLYHQRPRPNFAFARAHYRTGRGE